jgi:hypothetical protein
MADVSKPGSEEICHPEVRESCDVRLSLQPAELEELLARLCACSTRRSKSSERKRLRVRCTAGAGAEWCRLGARSAGACGHVETRFG